MFLSVTDLTLSFGGLRALNGLNLAIHKGEFIGLIGPNGAGKTSFFNVLTGLYAPTLGSIKLDGVELGGKQPQEIYNMGVSRTFQRVRLSLDLSLFDNIVIGNYRALHSGLLYNLFQRPTFRRELAFHREQIAKILTLFDPRLVNRMNEKVGALSMLDRRRVELCRALLSAPRLLLLDEPSAGMTESESSAFMAEVVSIREKLQDITIILIEHNMAVIKNNTERCIVMNYGSKIANGPYSTVTADRDVRTAYFGE